jgi:hypothetical protein
MWFLGNGGGIVLSVFSNVSQMALCFQRHIPMAIKTYMTVVMVVMIRPKANITLTKIIGKDVTSTKSAIEQSLPTTPMASVSTNLVPYKIKLGHVVITATPYAVMMYMHILYLAVRVICLHTL